MDTASRGRGSRAAAVLCLCVLLAADHPWRRIDQARRNYLDNLIVFAKLMQ